MRLQQICKDLGIALNFNAYSKIANSFLAHQMLDRAETHGKQHPLKLALFEAPFADALDMSDAGALIRIASSVGLNAAEASAVLVSQIHARSVRETQRFWWARGISGVPAMVFGCKYLLTRGAGRADLRRYAAPGAV